MDENCAIGFRVFSGVYTCVMLAGLVLNALCFVVGIKEIIHNHVVCLFLAVSLAGSGTVLCLFEVLNVILIGGDITFYRVKTAFQTAAFYNISAVVLLNIFNNFRIVFFSTPTAISRVLKFLIPAGIASIILGVFSGIHAEGEKDVHMGDFRLVKSPFGPAQVIIRVLQILYAITALLVIVVYASIAFRVYHTTKASKAMMTENHLGEAAGGAVKSGSNHGEERYGAATTALASRNMGLTSKLSLRKILSSTYSICISTVVSFVPYAIHLTAETAGADSLEWLHTISHRIITAQCCFLPIIYITSDVRLRSRAKRFLSF